MARKKLSLGVKILLVAVPLLITATVLIGAVSCSNKKLAEEIAPHPGSEGFEPTVEIQLIAKVDTITILPGKKTEVWTYEANLVKGSDETITRIQGSYLGPTIKVRKGDRVRVNFTNLLPEKSIVHWHGLHVPEDMDGHPRYAVEPGESYVYEFEVMNRAGTYLYHPHPHGITGKQVYYGLAGLFIVTDDEEAQASLPFGQLDLPIVVQDRSFNSDGSLSYVSSSTGHMGMMQQMWGFHGDRIMINGKADNVIPVKSAAYRFRIANVSNARIYKFYLSDGSKFNLIGTDGGLLEKPLEREYVILSPGERADVIVDFSDYRATEEIELRSAPLSGVAGGMMGGMMGGGSGMSGGMMGRGRGMGGGMMMSPAGIFDEDVLIATFEVSVKVNVPFELPEKLSSPDYPLLDEAVNRDDPRRFYFEMRMMQLTINGRSFEMNEVASDEIVKLGTTEVWEIVNVGPMPHPVHIHGLQFKIVAREGTRPEYVAGYTDGGWKDTFLLMPGERAYVLIRFEDFTGTYLYHCHNLEHSDLGMMRNFKVDEN